jgi:CheY-like chemotaxis protein
LNNNNNNNKNKNKYILLVDDEKDIVFTFEIYLKSIGYSTVSFDNPVEALNYFNKNFTNCSLVITDYAMPLMSGLDLIEKIREKVGTDKIKTIVISATIKNDLIHFNDKFLKLKVDKFLEKPLPLEKLKKEIKILIE